MNNILLELIGGLGIFLYGMEKISNGMQKIAGYKMKNVLERITSNLYKSISFGILSTTIIQSSSVITCLVVALVNSKLLTLNQSLGIILGTNIGTTITGWIFTLKIEEIAVPLVGLSTLGYWYSKVEKNRIKFLTLLGLGLVFLGLFLMGDALKPLRTNKDFINLFKTFKGDSFFTIIKIVSIGTVLTGIIQSSSAVLGIIIALGNQDLIDFQVAVALVIGANIGTTITPVISSISGGKEGKKTALFCVLIKVFQGVWALSLFNIYIEPLQLLFENTKLSYSIAMVHTLLNVINVFLFIPIYKIFIRKIKEKKEVIEKKDIKIDNFLKITTVSMAKELKNEFLKITLVTKEILLKIEKNLEEHNKNNIYTEDIENFYREIKNFQKENRKITFNNLKTSEKKGVVKKIMNILKGVKETEEISRYLFEISKKIDQLKKIESSEYEIAKIKIYHREFIKLYNELVDSLKINENESIYLTAQKVKILENEHKKIKKEYEIIIDSDKNFDEKNIFFLDVLMKYKRINYHLKEIIEIKINKYL